MADDLVAERRRQLGASLAEWRKLSGLNQAQLARRLSYDRTTVAHAERGAQIPAQEFWRACDQVLAAGGVLLRLYRGLQEAKRRGAESAAASARADRRIRLGEQATAAAADSAGDPQRRPSPAPSALVGRLIPVLFSATPKADIPSEPADLARLEVRVARAWELRQRAQYTGLGALLTGLLPDAEHAASQTESDDQSQAVRALTHAYNAASSLLKKLGDYGLALVAADRAVRAARSQDDPLLLAAAAHRLVNVLLPAGRLEETQQLAVEAADAIEPAKLTTPRSYAMWGALLLTAAVAAARRGDESGTWELIGEARTASRLLGRDHSDLYTIFGPTNVALHGVQIAVELHNGRDAIRRAERVDVDRLPPSLIERRAQYLIDLAVGQALERDDAAAFTTLERAERIAPEEVHYSLPVIDTVHAMLDRERTGAVSGLRELAGRLGVR
jgi:transcriptional regulator with XRE-family HTH domain